jgi:hypothetical protein
MGPFDRRRTFPLSEPLTDCQCRHRGNGTFVMEDESEPSDYEDGFLPWDSLMSSSALRDAFLASASAFAPGFNS